jgi:hypothetical protein
MYHNGNEIKHDGLMNRKRNAQEARLVPRALCVKLFLSIG